MSRLPFELSIPKPCGQQWSEMPGSSITRHCASCKTPVHNLEGLTPRQIERLSIDSGGHVCGRIARGLDGEIIVLRPEASLHSGSTLVMLAALAVQPAGAFAQQNGTSQAQQQQISESGPTACSADPTALAGVVTDAQGALVVGADVTLLLQGQVVGSTKSDTAGCFQFTAAPGNYELSVAAQGFSMQSKTIFFGDSSPRANEISLRAGNQVNIQVMAVDPANWSTMGAMAITYNHWYQRFGYRLRHPVAYFKYKVHHSHG